MLTRTIAIASALIVMARLLPVGESRSILIYNRKPPVS